MWRFKSVKTETCVAPGAKAAGNTCRKTNSVSVPRSLPQNKGPQDACRCEPAAVKGREGREVGGVCQRQSACPEGQTDRRAWQRQGRLCRVVCPHNGATGREGENRLHVGRSKLKAPLLEGRHVCCGSCVLRATLWKVCWPEATFVAPSGRPRAGGDARVTLPRCARRHPRLIRPTRPLRARERARHCGVEDEKEVTGPEVPSLHSCLIEFPEGRRGHSALSSKTGLIRAVSGRARDTTPRGRAQDPSRASHAARSLRWQRVRQAREERVLRST